MNSISPKKRAVNGVLLLDKPVGISSNGALQKARRLFRAEKAGHTGILDPLASGLLPVCLGEATKFAHYLLDADKAYRATLKLGEATSTGDAEGETVARNDVVVTPAMLSQACTALTGRITQIPPMFSALKHEGKPLYEYARQGITIERKVRWVEVHHIDIEKFDAPFANIRVLCSKGTYIRTLSEDIARHCGTFAHLTALRRTATAGFGLEQAYTLTQLAALSEDERDKCLLPCDVLVKHLPQVQLNDEDIKHLQLGQSVACGDNHLAENQAIRLYNSHSEFMGLIQKTHGVWKVVRLMKTSF